MNETPRLVVGAAALVEIEAVDVLGQVGYARGIDEFLVRRKQYDWLKYVRAHQHESPLGKEIHKGVVNGFHDRRSVGNRER